MGFPRILYKMAVDSDAHARGIAQPKEKGQDVCERCGLFVPVGKRCRCDIEHAPETVTSATRKGAS